MFQSIVVPLDGSAIAAQALPYATRIAAPGARIALVGVVEPPVNEYFNYSSTVQLADQMDFSREILCSEVEAQAKQLRAQGFAVTTTVPTGSATDEIIRCAHDAHADVIAMTTHGTGGVSRWLPGSVTNRVLHATQIPVLVVRAATADHAPGRGEIDRIIAPLDGSALGASAVEMAKALARQLALPLRLVRVVDDETSLLNATPLNDYEAARRLTQALTEARAVAERFLEDMTALSCATGIDATGVVLVGKPATTLIQYFEEQPNALVVIATHGEGSAQQWAFGSVAEKIVTTAPNPTLVLRPAIHLAVGLDAVSAKAARA